MLSAARVKLAISATRLKICICSRSLIVCMVRTNKSETANLSKNQPSIQSLSLQTTSEVRHDSFSFDRFFHGNPPHRPRHGRQPRPGPQGGRAAALQLDVARSAGFADFAARVRQALADTWQADRLDALVHNAGIGINAPFAATTEAQFDELVAIHLKAPFFLSQHLLPLLRDGGSIIHLSSGLTRFTQPGYAAYASMKGGVEVLTRYLARELGPRGIRVNTVAPGAIATDFGGGRVRDDAQVGAALASQTALGRVGQPDDIGPVVAALLQPGMGWVQGQRIEASGGMFL
jgi:NAD(P)-dependent dehydrogenase (short-subunit alcohol dehydrogenase family)